MLKNTSSPTPHCTLYSTRNRGWYLSVYKRMITRDPNRIFFGFHVDVIYTGKALTVVLYWIQVSKGQAVHHYPNKGFQSEPVLLVVPCTQLGHLRLFERSLLNEKWIHCKRKLIIAANSFYFGNILRSSAVKVRVQVLTGNGVFSAKDTTWLTRSWSDSTVELLCCTHKTILATPLKHTIEQIRVLQRKPP